MGALMRQYWLPACLSSELPADGDPLRLMLLGEKLIAFRDSAGRVGVLDHRCPHRGASLFFGRNEEGGLRCVYHGWKFDIAGQLPRHAQSAGRPGLPAQGQGEGLSGGRARRPRLRLYGRARRWRRHCRRSRRLLCPPDETNVWARQRECNWLQALEGDIDTSHFSFLHTGKVTIDDIDPDHLERFQFTDRAPRYHVRPTDWGTMYAAYRPAQPGHALLPLCPFCVSVLDIVPERSIDRQHPRPGLGPDGRHPHDVVHLQLDAQDPGAQLRRRRASRCRFSTG